MSSNGGGGGWILLAIAGGVVWYFYSQSDTAAKRHTAEKYGLPESKIQISGSRPHDCDFLTAPLGLKHCSYKRKYLAEWMTVSTARYPITYGNLQEEPPTTCSNEELDFAHRCYVTELQADEHAAPGWHARRVDIEWQKVEE